MITATNILYLYAETPLHAGTGSGLSNIDLPIQRERTTQYPMIQGSGIKGKLRALAEDAKLADLDVIFGSSREIKGPSKNGKNGTQTPGTAAQQDYVGALIVGDARILLFPVRSLNGIFAYTTSYDVPQRFARDLERSHVAFRNTWSVPDPVDEPHAGYPTALVSSRDLIIEAPRADDPQSMEQTIVLEEFSFNAQVDEDENGPVSRIARWLAASVFPANDTEPGAGTEPENRYWQEKLKRSLVILPNEDFRDFVLCATEVITHIGIERENKIVKEGALWTEEHLPSDTLLYVPIYATNSRRDGHTLKGKDILQQVSTLTSQPGSYLQLGGDETVGRGIVRACWGTVQTLREEETANITQIGTGAASEGDASNEHTGHE